MSDWEGVRSERKGRLGQLYLVKAYFTYGHSHWLGFMVSIGTFMMVAFQFLSTYWTWFSETFGVLDFILFAVPTYFIVAVILGRWDYKRGPYKNRAAMEWRENPVVKELFEVMFDIRNRIDKVERSIEKYERERRATE